MKVSTTKEHYRENVQPSMKTIEFKEAEFYLGLNGVPFFFKSVHFHQVTI